VVQRLYRDLRTAFHATKDKHDDPNYYLKSKTGLPGFVLRYMHCALAARLLVT
jgi:hypothetical protein